MYGKPGGDLLVIVVVPESSEVTEFACRRQPLKHVGLGAKVVVHLRRAHAECAQVVGEHRHVLELGMEFTFEPESRRVRPAKELVGGETVVHSKPVGELT